MAKATTELAVKTNGALIKSTFDVSSGGISASDFEMPKALLLQDTSPDVKARTGLQAGQLINSISKEVLQTLFIPLFAYKVYAKFNKGEISPEWSTSDRLDPRVEDGLAWNPAVNEGKPLVTEFINFLAVFKEGDAWNTDIPLVLAFKKTSLRAGKQFLTLTQMKGGGKAMYGYAYDLAVKTATGHNNTWFVPAVSLPKDKALHLVDEATYNACADLVARWRPIVNQLKVVDAEAESSEETPF